MQQTVSTVRPLTQAEAYKLVDAVTEAEDLALTATAFEDEETGNWVFEAVSGSEPDLAAYQAIARATLGADLVFEAELVDPETDWIARSLEGLAPISAGGFYIHGSHDAPTANASVTDILIDAAQAFGTGHHGTTIGCLEAINDLLKRRSPRRMIDIGTGTGILAIALAKRTRRPVLASDIDPLAVRTAHDNAVLNGVGNLLQTVEATGLENRTLRTAAPYDLIVANILAGPLVALAPDVARAAAPGATIILSGLLTTQAARVSAAYAHQGMVMKKRITKNEWATLVLEMPVRR